MSTLSVDILDHEGIKKSLSIKDKDSDCREPKPKNSS